MHLVALICALSVGFATFSSAALCDSLNATPAENVFGQQSSLKAPSQQPKKSKRGLLVCNSSEACLSLLNIPFCINTQTGKFHDADLTTGNGFTGDYVLADGREGNLYHGPFPTPEGPSTGPQATGTINNSGNFGIATAATDVNDQKATGAPINAPTKSVADGSGGSSGGSGVTTDAGKVPGGAGRAELRLRMGMWIVVTMFGSSILGALIF